MCERDLSLLRSLHKDLGGDCLCPVKNYIQVLYHLGKAPAHIKHEY